MFTYAELAGSDPGESRSGFTLLELIVSLNIISMIMLVLYHSFSMGVSVWDRKENRGDDSFLLESVVRLISDDLDSVLRYSMNWEQGSLLFFAGGPRTIFYVTGNAAGASIAPGSGLFFSCLYIDDCPEGTDQCLFLAKSGLPHADLIQELASFRDMPDSQKEYFTSQGETLSSGILLLHGIEDPSFFYGEERFSPFAGYGTEVMEQSMQTDEVSLDKHWSFNEMPGMILFSFTLDGDHYSIYGSWNNTVF